MDSAVAKSNKRLFAMHCASANRSKATKNVRKSLRNSLLPSVAPKINATQNYLDAIEGISGKN